MYAIYSRRKAAGLSQAELAVEVGVHQTAISQWETGETTPTVQNLMKLAGVFGCSLDDLFTEPDKTA